MQLAPELIYDLCAWSLFIIGLPALTMLAFISDFSGPVPVFMGIVEAEKHEKRKGTL